MDEELEKEDDFDDVDFERVPAYMLTTIDNPFHPLYQRKDWLGFNESHGYEPDRYLAKVYDGSVYLTEAQDQWMANEAIKEICRINPLYTYVVVDD